MKKRVFDLLFGTVLAVGTAPLIAAIGLAVALTSGFPIIFRQTRLGLNGEPFEIYKFRSMTNKKGPDGKLLSDLERVTLIGPFIRWAGLDELPQILNILKGDMSFVGPRPRAYFIEDKENEIPDKYREILSVPPGLTGPSQVARIYSGKISHESLLKGDFDYATKPPNLWGDLALIFWTMSVFVKGNGSVLKGPRNG